MEPAGRNHAMLATFLENIMKRFSFNENILQNTSIAFRISKQLKSVVINT